MLESIQNSERIPKLFRATIKTFPDDRGGFNSPFVGSEIEKLTGRTFAVAQTNQVINHRGSIRGYHVGPGRKLVYVTSGKIQVSYLDTRDMASFGAVEMFELNANELVYVPDDVGNSYLALEEGTICSYITDVEWYPGIPSHVVNLFEPLPGGKIPWAIDQTQCIYKSVDETALNLEKLFPERWARWKGNK
jgi:dTDP-4-dehydrorhamnose 3,5-epimerase-like enzyme